MISVTKSDVNQSEILLIRQHLQLAKLYAKLFRLNCINGSDNVKPINIIVFLVDYFLGDGMLTMHERVSKQHFREEGGYGRFTK